MKGYFFTTLLLLLFQGGPGNFNRIAQTNQLKEEAAEAYKAGKFEQAAVIYKTLVDSFEVNSEPLQLNLGHSLARSGKEQEADATYRTLAANANDKVIKSLAFQQLGVMATKKQNLKDAVSYFKQSLKAHPANDAARYNYELAKKKLQQQQDQQDQKKEDQPEPSEWAKELKKKAEQLVNRFRYQEAYDLMQQGLQQDPTVKAYENFINRIGTILEIEKGG